MENLSHRIDPRFLRPLADALCNGPLTELEISALFTRDVPNRNLSLRALHTLLDLAVRGGLLICEHEIWRLADPHTEDLLRRCLATWSAPGFTADALFQNRCSVCLDRGILSAQVEYTPLETLASRDRLTSSVWARLVSGPCDIRQLTGRETKHVEADVLKLYRNSDTPPIADDTDVVPRLEARLFPALPATPEALLTSIRAQRSTWQIHLRSFLGSASVHDFSTFIVYAKDMLDLLFWGRCLPLRSTITAEHLTRVSERMQKYGLRAENFSIAWRSMPGIYCIISQLSWGVRYLSNNLAHPQPPDPDVEAFLRVCALPAATQSAISSARKGHSLLGLTRSLRVIHRALTDWQGKESLTRACQECISAVAADRFDDKLQRRAFAERTRRLQTAPPIYILDALADELTPPLIPTITDAALSAAAVISGYSNFIDSVQGYAYAELRLAFHSELDFRNRFNRHSVSSLQRYDGIWRESLEQLVTRLEDLRSAATLMRGF